MFRKKTNANGTLDVDIAYKKPKVYLEIVVLNLISEQGKIAKKIYQFRLESIE